jgi:hypothetical protein
MSSQREGVAAVISQFNCRNEGGVIRVDGGYDRLSKTVMAEGAAVVKGAFEGGPLLAARRAIMEWAATTPQAAHGTALQNVGHDVNFHRVDDDPTKSSAPHIHHNFNFNRIDLLSEPLRGMLFSIYESMRLLQNSVAGTSARFSPTEDQYKLRPQVIHYPAGGGFFVEHVHPLEPQRIGLILALSQRGVDHTEGAGTFTIDGKTVDASPQHDMGDIVLFRYDILHGVTAVDPNKTMDWSSSAGRWSMVLPYY